MRHLAGRTLTPKQVEGNRRAGGQTITFYAEQLMLAIENDVVDWQDAGTVDGLARLHMVLSALPLREEVA